MLLNNRKLTLGLIVSVAVFSAAALAVRSSMADAAYTQSVVDKLVVEKIEIEQPPVEEPVVLAYESITEIEEELEVIEQAPILPSQEIADALEVAEPTAEKVQPVAQESVPQKNWIRIPKMGVDTAILEGETAATLNQGVWHIPGTSSPDRGGNVVVSAHRYKWLPPSTRTFWDIDKMEVGDEIYVTWNGEEIVYRVTGTEIVTPDRVDILKNTGDHKLTIFSCTPKFTSDYRLVVEAYPVEA